MAFKRVTSNLLLSPIWKKETAEVKVLWVTLLLIQDNSGFIDNTEDEIENISKLPHDKFKQALYHLLGYSLNTTPEDKPLQRLIKLSKGYKIRHHLSIDKVKKTEIPLWRENTENGYKAYIDMVDKAYYTIEKDLEWFKYMKTIYPNVLVGETLQHSYSNYWGTKAGWEQKRKKKGDTIDMIKTIKNTIKFHLVYNPRGKADYELSYINKLQVEQCTIQA